LQQRSSPQTPLSLNATQRLLVQVFRPALASNAIFGTVLGALLAVLGGVLLAAIYLAFAHAFVPQGVFHIGTFSANDTLVDILLGIIPLHSPLRESLQFYLVMHGVATNVQLSAASGQVTGSTTFTFVRPLNGLLILPALLLTLGGYVSASTDFQNRARSSLLRGAAIAIPYTLLLFILLLIVNGSIPLDALQLNVPKNTSTAIVATLNMDIFSLLAFGLLWGTLFGLLGASLKLAQGQWRHSLFHYLQTNRYSRISSAITGALAATGVGVFLSLLLLCCLLVYLTASTSTSLLTGSASAVPWQTLVLASIAYLPLLAVNLFFLSLGVPGNLAASCSSYSSFFSLLCSSSSGSHVTLSLFGSTPPLPSLWYPWIYALLAVPAISLFLGGRVSAFHSGAQSVGAGTLQGALIALPFVLLLMLLTLLTTVRLSFTGSFGGIDNPYSLPSYTASIGVGIFELFPLALLFGVVLGALGGIYQASAIKRGVRLLLADLCAPFRLLGKPAFFILDRLSGQPRNVQRSPVRSWLYSTFLCTLLLAIVADIGGGLLISLNQTLSFDDNLRILSIGAVLLVALPGLLLLCTCASAFANDPLQYDAAARKL